MREKSKKGTKYSLKRLKICENLGMMHKRREIYKKLDELPICKNLRIEESDLPKIG
jgi:hypothetical protein